MLPIHSEWFPTVFDSLVKSGLLPKTNVTAPAINVLENDTEYVVELAAPGLKKEDFNVHINQEGNLAIKMEQKEAHEKNEKWHYLRREFSYSQFEQNLILPDDVDKDKISAKVEDGILTVTLPKYVAEPKPTFRQINID